MKRITRKYLDGLVDDLSQVTGRPHAINHATHYGGYILSELTGKGGKKRIWGYCSGREMEAYLIGRLWDVQEKQIEADLEVVCG